MLVDKAGGALSAVKRSVFVSLDWYMGARKSRPILTASITSGTIFVLGDYLAQHIVEKKEKHDWSRTGRMLVVGSCYTGPILTKW